MKYKHIEEYSLIDLDITINDFIEHGWEIDGNLVVVKLTNNDFQYIQKMVMYKR